MAICGNGDSGWIVNQPDGGAGASITNSMPQGPGENVGVVLQPAFASSMACRSEPEPVSFVFVTWNQRANAKLLDTLIVGKRTAAPGGSGVTAALAVKRCWGEGY